MDPHDCHKFKIIIRSSRTIDYMYTAEPDLAQLMREGGLDDMVDQLHNNPTTSSASNSTPLHGSSTSLHNLAAAKVPTPKPSGAFPMHTKFTAPKLVSSKFLKPRTKTNFWQLTVRVENEQACRLAVQHIEGKRKEQAAAKMIQFQRILEHWSSDLEVNVNEH